MEKLLELKGVTKRFPGVVALDHIDMDLYPGEVHVILGENGAGKSTLMKVLSGAYQADEGEVILEGKRIARNSPLLAEAMGIQMIYQELNLVPELSIQENIFLGHEWRKGIFKDQAAMYQKTRELLEGLGIRENPDTPVGDLGVGTRQMIEIAKALSKNAKIIVFDEPTSSLSSSEIQELFRIIRELRTKGVGMFYISHHLEETFEIGDRVSIMRDGKLIRTADAEDMSMEEIIEGIAGRVIEVLYPHEPKQPGKPLLEIRGLEGERFHQIDMTIRAGEIVGLAGLVGAGRSEIARAVFGIDRYTAGEVLLNGKKVPGGNPGKAVKLGLCLLPEDRKTEGLALSLNIRENVTVASLNDLYPKGIVREKKADRAVMEYVKSLDIATPSIEKYVQFLSGGTQQKVVIAKWLLSKSNVFIFDEPTRGIDVGAKTEIYKLMDSLIGQGAGILMISSDLPEVMGMSDRIYVLHNGVVRGELNAREASQSLIMKYAFGQDPDEGKTDLAGAGIKEVEKNGE